jgi:PAS domain-containing protein
MGEVAAQLCGCPLPVADGWYGLVDPSSELLIELDEHASVVGGFPHISPLIKDMLCRTSDLSALLTEEVRQLVVDRAEVVRSAGQPSSLESVPCGLRIRVAPHRGGVVVLLRGAEIRAMDVLARSTMSEESFWQLFEAAPLPLAIEIAVTPTGEGASRLNRRFTEVFGYTAADVPTVQHWWPLAYPDPDYRAVIRDEWFRRIGLAVTDHSRIAPMETTVVCKDGSQREIEFFAAAVADRHVVVFVDHTERKRAARLLHDARAEVQALTELLPICAWCKKLRDDKGYWQLLEEFIGQRTGATVTHGICPDCRTRYFVGRQG